MPRRDQHFIKRDPEVGMNWSRVGAPAFVAFLLFYLTIAFIGWDITWIRHIDTWEPLFRFLMSILIFVCVCIGGFVEVCSRDD